MLTMNNTLRSVLLVLIMIGYPRESFALTACVGQTPHAASRPSNPMQLHPGPMFKERKQLLSDIHAASVKGIGVSSYSKVFEEIEHQVIAGAGENDIKSKVVQLSNALKEQSQRLAAIRFAHTQQTRSMGARSSGVGAGSYRGLPRALFASVGTGHEVAAAAGKERGGPPAGLDGLPAPTGNGNVDQAAIRRSAAETMKQRLAFRTQQNRLARAIPHP